LLSKNLGNSYKQIIIYLVCFILLIIVLYDIYDKKEFIHNKTKEIYKRFSKEYRQNYLLSIEQKEALIGIMLGDGYIHRIKPTCTANLYIEQAYPEKKDYLFSLFQLYKPLVLGEPIIKVRKPDKRTGKIYKSIRFTTSSFNVLNEYHDLFYKDKKKIVPKNIHELLTARGLAY
jgi:competence protein ComGC